MPRVGDAFGRALVDWGAGGTDPEVFERSDGAKDLGAGHDLYFAEHRRWPASEREALLEARGRVLDVGCGAGRVSLHLQGLGFDVVGMDSSKLAVRTARARGLRRTWHMRAEALGERVSEFDTVLLFGNNFGIFGAPARIRRALCTWARETGPKARILAQSTSPYFGGAPLVDRGYFHSNKKKGAMPGALRLRICYRYWVTPWFDWVFVSRGEMRELLHGTGWHLSKLYGTDVSEPYVALLEKASTRARIRGPSPTGR